MSEKFRKVINAPHIAAGKLKEKIKNTNPEKKFGKFARGAGIGTVGTAQFLLWLTKYVALDNQVIRASERGFANIKVGTNKEGKEKKFPKFIKKHSTATSIVSWWMFLAVLGGCGKMVFEEKDNVVGMEQSFDDEKFETGTYGDYFDRVRTITPFLIADLIAKEGVHVDENGMHTPYKDSNGIWTIGFGSTMLKDGTRVQEDTQPITNEEAYELAKWHLEEGETYFAMYCYDVAYGTVNIDDVNEAFAMGSIIYNAFSKLIEPGANRNSRERFTILRNLYKEYGRGLTDDMVIDVFNQYPVNEPTSFGQAWLSGEKPEVVADKLGNFLRDGRGLYWRRWLEAGLLTGDVTPQMLLDCPVNGVYEFFECMGGKREAFFTEDENGRHVNKETYAKFKEWLANPVNKKGLSLSRWKQVRDFMPEYALEACDGKVCTLGAKPSKKHRVQQRKVERETYVIDYENMYAEAMNAYNNGDYQGALDILKVLSSENPDNALLHNDLAVTYNHLGRYDDAIRHAKEILERIGDKSQYASAQYNAGYAYEQLGDLENALKNYELSVSNGNSRARSCVTRVRNQLNANKTIAFNSATGNIKSKMNNDTISLGEINAESRA